MIIWIDGAYGVGKTVVAKGLSERFDVDVELLESDYYFDAILKKIVAEAMATQSIPTVGGCLPQNNIRFIREFKKIIEEKSNDSSKKLIVDMALTRIECKENLFDALQNVGKAMIHIILMAEEDTLKLRIKNDDNRMKEAALDWLKYNLSFLNDNYPDAVRINTDNRDVDDIVDEIIKIIRLNENKI